MSRGELQPGKEGSWAGISRQHRDAKAFCDCLFRTTVEGLSIRGE